MHFITMEGTRDEKTGQLYGCRLQLWPLLSNNLATSRLYCELWWRIRRHTAITHKLDQNIPAVDASIYMKGNPGIEHGIIDAVILLSTAHHTKETEMATLEWLQRMDDLLVRLCENDDYATELLAISREFESIANRSAAKAGTKPIGLTNATESLKDLLKRFCREQGLYIDASDVERIKAERKAARRAAFENGVKAGHIQMTSPRSTKKRRSAEASDTIAEQ